MPWKLQLAASNGELKENYFIPPVSRSKRIFKKVKFIGVPALFFGLGSIVGINYYNACAANLNQKPYEAYPAGDLDKNGIEDLVIVSDDRYKLPLYGLKYKNKLIYVTAAVMETTPSSVIDYDSIEKRLNAK